MWSIPIWSKVGRPLVHVQPFISNPNFLIQSRTTYVLKRRHAPPSAGTLRAPSLRKKHQIYETVSDNHTQVLPQLQILLKKYVEDLGGPGDLVSLKANKARYLLLTKSAVYPTQDEILKAGVKIDEEKNYSSKFVGTTLNLLSNFVLNISMNSSTPWTLTPAHIRSAFRKAHVHVPEYAFTMPKETISGPDLESENKEFYITVTINSSESQLVRCRLHHWSTDISNRLPIVRDHWKFPVPPLSSEDSEIMKSLPEIIPPVFNEEDDKLKLKSNLSSSKNIVKKKKKVVKKPRKSK